MSIAAPLEVPGKKSIAGIVTTALLLVALAMLLDGPIWLVKLVPTQDGPVHLAQADLIARFGWGGVLQEPAASFYQWNPRIEPNSAIYLLLASLIRLTGDALIANSLFLSLYGMLWIGAAYAISRSETERPILPMLLLLPIAFGIFIHWGFYNFALGVPLFLLFAAFWRSVRERGDAMAFVTVALFLAALYLTHITAVVAACLLLAADGVSRARSATSIAPGLRTAGRRLMIDGAWAAAAALPVLLLIASFLMAYQNIPGEAPGTDGGVTQIFRRIFRGHVSLQLHVVGIGRAGSPARCAGDRRCCGAATDYIRRFDFGFDLANFLRVGPAAVAGSISKPAPPRCRSVWRRSAALPS